MKEILDRYPKSVVKRAKDIRAIICDVDGVLTDGRIIYDEGQKEWKHFNVKDGQIVSHLKKAGIVVGAISGRESGAVTRRAAELKFDFCHQGILDKAATFTKLVGYHKLKRKQVCYVGDDINDLEVFDLAGMSVCPSDSPVYIKKRVDLTTFAKGGEGVLREVADLVLAARGLFKEI